MATDVISIFIKAVDEASGVIKGVDAETQRLGNTTKQVSASSSIAWAAVGAAVLAAGIQVGKTTIELAKMGQESAQLEARFRAFNGGAIEAAKSLDIMTAAVNGALTKDDQMLALNRVMGSGLVTTAEQAAQLAQAALLLSSETGNATEKVMGLTQALLSGRDRALIPYGINIEEFRRRVAELTTGEDELSKSQAALNAFMEQAPGLMAKVKQEGGDTATQFDKLTVSIGNLKDALGGQINSSGLFNTALERINDNLRRTAETVERQTASYTSWATVTEKVTSASETLARAQENMAKAIRTGYGEEAASRAVALAEANLAVAKSAQQAISPIKNLAYGYGELGDALAYVYAQNKGGFVPSTFKLPQNFPTTGLQSIAPWAAGGQSAYGQMLLKNTNEAQSPYGVVISWLKTWEGQSAVSTTRITDSAVSSWSNATQRIVGMFDTAINASIALRDFRPGGGPAAALLPGGNGPFEDLNRLAAFATDGSWREIADKLKASGPGQAEALLGKFQSGPGMWDAQVMGAIDWQKFASVYQQQKQSEIAPDALASKIAPFLESGADAAGIAQMILAGVEKEGEKVKKSGEATVTAFNTGVTSQKSAVQQLGTDMILWALDTARAELAKKPPTPPTVPPGGVPPVRNEAQSSGLQL